MLLVADIGNTHLHLGIYDGAKLLGVTKLTAEQVLDLDESWDRFGARLGTDRIEGAALCSVNPKMKIPFAHWIDKRFGARPKVVGESLRLDMPLRVDDPAEVGADRIVNAYAAWRDIGKGPIVIVDAGTAITLDVVSAAGEYLGGAIAPGFQTAAKALSSLTALLPYIRVTKADKAIGHNTVDAMRSGLYFGLMGLVDALCERVAAELGGEVRWIATGGDGELIAEASKYVREVRPNLTLEGLRLGWEAAKT